MRPDVAPQAAQATTLDLRRARLWQERGGFAPGRAYRPVRVSGWNDVAQYTRSGCVTRLRFFLDANDQVTSAIGFLRPYSAIDRTAVSVIETRHVSAGDLCRAVACVEHSALLVRSRDDV